MAFRSGYQRTQLADPADLSQVQKSVDRHTWRCPLLAECSDGTPNASSSAERSGSEVNVRNCILAPEIRPSALGQLRSFCCAPIVLINSRL
jgi:hypothetical protein